MTKKRINKKWLENFKKLAKKYNVPDDVVDFYSLIDDKLTYNENKQIILEFIKSISNKTAEITAEELTKREIEGKEDRADREFREKIREEEEKTLREFEKSMSRIKRGETIDRHYYTIREYIKILCKKTKLNGLIIEGETAIGKSYQVIKTLIEMGLKNEKDYVVLSTYSTPLELYHFLYENRDKIIVLDDMLRLFENDISKAILLSALWSATDVRVVNYKSSSDRLDAPKSFIFNGKIIIICNYFPAELETLKSRCLYYNLKFNYYDKIKIIYEICKIEKIPREIADFIKENTDTTTENLNFRLPIKVYEIYKNHKNWKKLAKEQLEDNEMMKVIRELLDEDISQKKRVEKFTERTGYSRRTFFRYLKKLREYNGEI